MAEGIGWIDNVQFAIEGWAAESGVAHPIQAFIEVFRLDDQGRVIEPAKVAQYLHADGHRPDVPASDTRVVGEYHGFSLPLPPSALPDGGYMVRVRAIANPQGWLLPGEVRVVRVTTGSPHVTFSLRYQGVVGGLARANDYESYPTAMRDGDTINMWFAGGPGDKIYYASSQSPTGFDGFTVWGNFTPVLGEEPTGPDSGLTADPSVVKVPFADPAVPYRYFMFYTAVPAVDGRNGVFAALSTDGVNWIKMDPRDHSFGNPYPVILPQHQGGTTDYGAGQSSVIWTTSPLGGMPPGFLHYFTDTSAGGPCVGVSTDGGWTFHRYESPLSPYPGDYTWDFKLHESGRVIGFVALPAELFVAPDGKERRRGTIGISVSNDGRHFSPQARVPMQWLHTDVDRQCNNNGGLLGTAEGYIGNGMVFYFGAGYGMQDDPQPYGRWPPLDWDIAAVSIRIWI